MSLLFCLISLPYSLLFTDLKQTSWKGLGLPGLSTVIGLGFIGGLHCASFFVGILKMNVLVIDSCMVAYSMRTKVKYEEPVDHS